MFDDINIFSHYCLCCNTEGKIFTMLDIPMLWEAVSTRFDFLDCLSLLTTNGLFP